MSGNEKKPPTIVKIAPKAKGRVRSLLMEMVKAVDLNTADGKLPLCGFVVIVNEDGTVEMGQRFNKRATDAEMAKLNWRHMSLAFSDMARDCQNFSLYHRTTTYDLVNEVPEEKEE